MTTTARAVGLGRFDCAGHEGIKPWVLSEKTARYSREHVGSDYIGRLHFQTLYSHIAETQPDMFART